MKVFQRHPQIRLLLILRSYNSIFDGLDYKGPDNTQNENNLRVPYIL